MFKDYYSLFQKRVDKHFRPSSVEEVVHDLRCDEMYLSLLPDTHDGLSFEAISELTTVSPDSLEFSLSPILKYRRLMDWSADGRYTAITNLSGRVEIWDTKTERKCFAFGCKSLAVSLAWAPKSNLLAIGYFDRTIRIWDLTGKRLYRTLGSYSIPLCIAWSSDEETILAGSLGGFTSLWELDSAFWLHISRFGEEAIAQIECKDQKVSMVNVEGEIYEEAITSFLSTRVPQPGLSSLRSCYSVLKRNDHGGLYIYRQETSTMMDFNFELLNRYSSQRVAEQQSETPGDISMSVMGGTGSGMYIHALEIISRIWTTDNERKPTLVCQVPKSSETAPTVHARRTQKAERWVARYEKWPIDHGSNLLTGIGGYRILMGEDVLAVVNGKNIRIFDRHTQSEIQILEGHISHIVALEFSKTGQLLGSLSSDGTVFLWRCDNWQVVSQLTAEDIVADLDTNSGDVIISGFSLHPTLPIVAFLITDLVNKSRISVHCVNIHDLLQDDDIDLSVQYLNAKVVLVGNSGVGKSGLGIRLAEGEFRPTASTHGAQFWQMKIPDHMREGEKLPYVQDEITLWDFAGQPEYHLIHQLFLDDADVALLLFDCSDPSAPFRGVPYWAKVLKKQGAPHLRKILVSSRVDVSPVTVDRREINTILSRHELDRYVQTSALTGEGTGDLLRGIVESIPWDRLVRTTTPRLFQVVRELLLEWRASGKTFAYPEDVQAEALHRYTERKASDAEITTVVELLQARGFLCLLQPRPEKTLILLRPELLNRYAASLIQAARNHPEGIGAIPERDALTAQFSISGFDRLSDSEEIIVLQATVELLLRHNLCFREMGLLVFPSQIRLTRPRPATERPPAEVIYRFSGALEMIYASLVVRLSHTEYFEREEQWKYAAGFSCKGHRLGFSMREIEEGTAELAIYFYPGVVDFDRVTFIHFITDHLRTKGIDIEERIRLCCSQCGKEVKNWDAIETRVRDGKLDIPCQYCGAEVMIPRSIEELYDRDAMLARRHEQLRAVADSRTRKEMREFVEDRESYSKSQAQGIRILHLSDLHFNERTRVKLARAQLETDLSRELKVTRLDYLIISGDIASHSTEPEYEAAYAFLDGLTKRFALDPSRIIIVPGNHDLNWDLSTEAYALVPQHKLSGFVEDDRCIPAGPAGMLVRDEESYRHRFANFSAHFYKKVFPAQEYPMAYDEQAIVRLCADHRLLFLALNSACQIDHYYKERAGIHPDALAHALDQIQDAQYDDWLKVVVFHHPVTGADAMNDDFLQLLSVHGFQIGIHGHLHEARQGFYSYDPDRGLHLIGAGTFGSRPKGQVPGIPLQYNLLTLDPETRSITVETRKKEKPHGAWMADARWGDKNNPVPRYTIHLAS